MRTELLSVLEANDVDPDVRVTVIRGGGACFSSGYDLGGDLMKEPPFHTAPGDGSWARHVTQNWFDMWDLAKPVIAQVHGYAIAGATELAQACDLVYVASDARISYPIVRVASPPDFEYHDDDSYRGYAAAMRDAAVEARAACEKKDYDAARTAVGKIEKSCDACHGDYRSS